MSEDTRKDGVINVLLVEDNPGDVRLTEEMIREVNLDCKMQVVNNGSDAIDYLKKKGAYDQAVTPHVILLDLNIPGKSGLEILQEVKSTDNLMSIPVVVLTTSESDGDISGAHQLKADQYMLKPLTANQFLYLMRQMKIVR